MRRTPPPGITIACAVFAMLRSIGGESSSRRISALETMGVDRASSAAVARVAMARPARGCRPMMANPTNASSNNPVGGRISDFAIALIRKMSGMTV
ncbi:MAG: hypothetical protein IPF60_17160 [Betaproteobacteria bacterium]|nr:hypothetical protein [Betaproteobacteria bacterium]